MQLQKTKLLTERELFLLQGTAIVNEFLQNKVEFQIAISDKQFVPNLSGWADTNCMARIAISISNSEIPDIMDAVLYFEKATDCDKFLKTFSNMKV